MVAAVPSASEGKSHARVAPWRLPWLEILMALSVAVVALASLRDESEAATASLADFAEAQTTLAEVTAAGLSVELSRTPIPGERGGPEAASADVAADGSEASARAMRRLIAGSAWLERRAVVLVLPPHADEFRRVDGNLVRSTVLREAVRADRSSIFLTRAQAAALGLPYRSAMAGIAVVTLPSTLRWAVVVARSARPERDRQARARWRLVLGATLVGLLMVGFASVALRTQRREFELQQALIASDLQRAREEHLAREGRAAMMLTFAAGVAHEVSTPLSVIAGRAEQIEWRSHDERTSRAATAILEQTERIRGVIRGFLQLARGGDPVLERVAPAAVVRAAIGLAQHRFSEAGVGLEARISDSLSMISGDARLLEQALVNLLLNACDACERGGEVEVHASVDGTSAMFAVLDDGKGISDEIMARVLEPFFTTKPTEEGTGLGLAITSEIVAIHRGTLKLEPRDPRGTIATMRVPTDAGRS